MKEREVMSNLTKNNLEPRLTGFHQTLNTLSGFFLLGLHQIESSYEGLGGLDVSGPEAKPREEQRKTLVTRPTWS